MRPLQRILLSRIEQYGGQANTCAAVLRRRQNDLHLAGSHEVLTVAFDEPDREFSRVVSRITVRQLLEQGMDDCTNVTRLFDYIWKHHAVVPPITELLRSDGDGIVGSLHRVNLQ